MSKRNFVEERQLQIAEDRFIETVDRVFSDDFKNHYRQNATMARLFDLTDKIRRKQKQRGRQ